MRRLEHVYRRRIPPEKVITSELARLLSDLSREIRRQIGILVERRGTIALVIVGDQKGLTIPELSRDRTGILRLRGLRLIHTHLQGEPLNEEDLTDLALLRLDVMVALSVRENDVPENVYSAHLLPDNREKKVWEIDPTSTLTQLLELDFYNWIEALEDEFQRGQRAIALKGAKERAILLSVSRESRTVLEDSIEELKELAETSGVQVVDAMIQRPRSLSPATLLGEGKLKELLVTCLQLGVDLIIFDQNLTPGQIASISDRTELRVIDRTQLILDIFARRAHTREGKIQVELAQLKYLLPRLAKKTLAFSRLTGGIGGRGPGETKLEIDRRRARERIHLLEKELDKLSRTREQRRARRSKSELPVLSIVGYTNAGKTTLFNLLTQSQSHVEDKLFATLDPATRRWRFPGNHEVVITDTVGLIKNLPKDLIVAFRPTFDELQESDLLIHLVDISNPFFEAHIQDAEKILSELGLDHIPRLLVFNKEDRLDPEAVEALCRRYDTFSISGHRPESLKELLVAIEQRLWKGTPSTTLPVESGELLEERYHDSLRRVGGEHGRPF